MELDFRVLDDHGVLVSEEIRRARTRILTELRIACPSDDQFNTVRKRVHDVFDDVHNIVNEMMKYITSCRNFKAPMNPG